MKSIPIPKRLEGRPRYRGFPIPYIAVIKSDGDPDFRVVDEAKRIAVLAKGVCQLCGERLGKYLFFVGGPKAAEARQYFEPPIHLDCLLYAMQVCPFILGKIEHAEISKVQEKIAATDPDMIVRFDETFTTVRDPQWVIIKAMHFRFIATPGGTLLVSPLHVQYQSEILYPDKMSQEDWAKVKRELERRNSSSI